MLTIEHWNKLIHEAAAKCRKDSMSQPNKEWEEGKKKFREIFLPFLDWCEEESMFLKSREFIREYLHRIEPSLISKTHGVLFFWEIKAGKCEHQTIEDLMNAVEKQLE